MTTRNNHPSQSYRVCDHVCFAMFCMNMLVFCFCCLFIYTIDGGYLHITGFSFSKL